MGAIDEGFLLHAVPAPDEEVGLRTILRVSEAGEYDLTVSAPVPARIWTDGIEQPVRISGRDSTARVVLGSPASVVEYRLRAPAKPEGNPLGLPPGSAASRLSTTFSTALTVEHPGTRVPRPGFVVAGSEAGENGTIRFRRLFGITSTGRGSVVVGASCAARVLLDGVIVAQQEQVQYYESGIGSVAAYFTHDIGRIALGEHVLEVVLVGADGATPVFVDLAIESDGDTVVFCSGDNWTAGPADSPAIVRPGLGGGTANSRVVRRAHPLAGAEWLTGAPDIGRSAVAFECAVSVVPRSDRFAAILPAGASHVALSADPAYVAIDGVPAACLGRDVVIDPPLDAPATLEVMPTPRVFSAGAAAWESPIVVRTGPAPALFVDWAEQGLSSWSGGMRYTATVQLGSRGELRLDLGRV